MSSNFFKSNGLLTVAVGAGVMIGAAGVFLYEHIIKEKRRLVLQQDVMSLGMSVSELRRELHELRDSSQTRRRLRRAKRDEGNTSTASDSRSEVDMLSIVDDDDEEFFDFSDVEDHQVAISRDWHDSPEDKFYRNIDEKLSSPDLLAKIEAYDELKQLQATNESDPEVLWRLAKACHGIGVIKGLTDDFDAKKSYIDEDLWGISHRDQEQVWAKLLLPNRSDPIVRPDLKNFSQFPIAYATTCLEKAPRSAEAHKWYAITVGSRGEFQPTKNRIKDGFVFKEHIEEALIITPNDPTLLHLLGRFRYEVATLSWVERKIASTLFGDIPYATFPEAVEPLLRAEELNKTPWKENRLILAKCYIQMGEFVVALDWLDKAYDVEPRSMEEIQQHKEIQQLLEKYERYRKKRK